MGTTQFITLTNQTLGISFEYPTNWEFDEWPMEYEEDYHEVTLESPDESTNIELAVFISDDPLSKIREEFNFEIEDLIEDSFTYKSSKISNSPFKSMLEFWESPSSNMIFNKKGTHFYGFDDFRAYYLTLEADDPISHARYLPIFNHIVKSFTLSDIESSSDVFLQNEIDSIFRDIKKDEQILGLSECSTHTDPLNPQISIYEDISAGIKMNYPSEWSCVKQGIPKSLIVTFQAPTKSIDIEGYLQDIQEGASEEILTDKLLEDFSSKSASVNVWINPSLGYTLNDYTNYKLEEMGSTFADFSLINTISTNLGDRNADTVIFTTSLEYRDFKGLQIWTIDGNKAYEITYLASLDAFNDYLGDVESMINSFKINN